MNKYFLNIKSDDGGWFRSASRMLSTVELPDELDGIGLTSKYETCLFANGCSEVVARANTNEEAINVHDYWFKLSGMKRTTIFKLVDNFAK